jgi:hypothetical protein
MLLPGGSPDHDDLGLRHFRRRDAGHAPSSRDIAGPGDADADVAGSGNSVSRGLGGRFRHASRGPSCRRRSRARRVHGAANHPYTQGVVCGKVARYTERIYHPDRLTAPLRRPMRFPLMTSTSSAQTDGQSCGQTGSWREMSSGAFIQTPDPEFGEARPNAQATWSRGIGTAQIDPRPFLPASAQFKNEGESRAGPCSIAAAAGERGRLTI